jgi:methyl-accepting chemotaxis protein
MPFIMSAPSTTRRSRPRPAVPVPATAARAEFEALQDELDAVRAELSAAQDELHEYRTGIAIITAVCRQTAEGNLEDRILGIRRDGPLGSLARGINHMLDLTDAFVREARASLQHASDEKYWRRVLERGLLGSYRQAARLINGATDQMAAKTRQLREAEALRLHLADEFEAAIKVVVDNVAAAATEARATAESLSATAHLTSEQSTTVAASSEEASRGMESVAAAAEQITATVGHIEDQARASRDMATTAVASASRTNDTVVGLSTASQQISRAVKLITDIASQTRLLALNAAIEAARAGEVGRGFAVVAAEVKSLATKTGEATSEIGAQVQAIQAASDNAVQAIGGISGTIGDMFDLSNAVSEAVRNQRYATDEINRNIHEAAQGTRQVTGSIAMVSQSVGETSTASGQMLQAADELSRMAERLRHEVDRFLGVIRGGRSS